MPETQALSIFKNIILFFQNLKRKLAIETFNNTTLATKNIQFADLMLEKEAEIKKLKEESRKLKTEVTVIYKDCLLNILYRRKLTHFSELKKPLDAK